MKNEKNYSREHLAYLQKVKKKSVWINVSRVAILAIFLCCIEVFAQQKLSKLDLSRSFQTYSTAVIGKSATGEEAIIAGKKCKDAVGVYPKSVINTLFQTVSIIDIKIVYDIICYIKFYIKV